MSTALESSPAESPVAGRTPKANVDGTMMRAIPIPERVGPWAVRPAVGFLHPLDVLKDQDLDLAAKREILASWASDASAVEGRPTQRWLLGTPTPVPLSDVLEALRRLDGAKVS